MRSLVGNGDWVSAESQSNEDGLKWVAGVGGGYKTTCFLGGSEWGGRRAQAARLALCQVCWLWFPWWEVGLGLGVRLKVVQMDWEEGLGLAEAPQLGNSGSASHVVAVDSMVRSGSGIHGEFHSNGDELGKWTGSARGRASGTLGRPQWRM